MKKLIKSFTPYQIIYLAAVFVLTAAFVIFLPDLMLDDTSNVFVLVCSVIATLANPVCELLISKQSRMNFIVDILFIEIPEAVVCLWNGWYAILVATLVFWIPIDILSFIRWKKNMDETEEEKTVVRRLPWVYDILIVIGITAFAFLVGTGLNAIPGASESYLDALAAAFGMANGILLMLRLSEQWYAWFITLVLYAILYTVSGSYILLITVAAMFVNTVYGFVKWLVYTKKHGKVVVIGRKGNRET